MSKKKKWVKRPWMHSGDVIYHRQVWEKANGPIPEGCHIHHKDRNPYNNSLDNLECLTKSEHMKLHANLRREELSAVMKEHSEELHAWHRSRVGRKSLSEKAKAEAAERPFRTFTCIQCNKEFQSKSAFEPKFCGDSCVMKARRLSGVDNEDRTCVICSKTFVIDRYQKTKTCSWECRNRLLSQLKKKLDTSDKKTQT